MTTASINTSGVDRPAATAPDEATTEYVVRLRDALAALYDDPLSLEAGRQVSALL
ncbi:hypothetical protein ACQ7HM_10260 [Williamsia sp. MIQD14]|uniref:hypothetical protein n=1 Tax=Williamsia sp. MIQD14 TaxID=3425703 RepID=UPI003DA0C058